MRPVVLGDKIKILGLQRVHGCVYGFAAGRADRRGGQAGLPVRIIWRVCIEVAHGDGPGEFFHGVADGGVAVELHSSLQAVVKYRGDELPLIVHLRFLFDQRRHGQHLMEAHARPVRGPFAGDAHHLRVHGGDDVPGIGRLGEHVGVGEEVAFGGGRVDALCFQK